MIGRSNLPCGVLLRLGNRSPDCVLLFSSRRISKSTGMDLSWFSIASALLLYRKFFIIKY